MFYILPLIISMAIGIFTIGLLLGKERPKPPLTVLLGLLLGLGISAMLTWSSFVLFDKLVKPYVMAINILLAGGLGYLLHRRTPLTTILAWKTLDRLDYAAMGMIVLLTLPTFIHATLFPYGGWDAWSCWNLKVKFLFEGDTAWRNMFDPLLWRSNISYPLLLPLINTWVLSFGTAMPSQVPLMTSCLITALTAGILLFALKEGLQRPWWGFVAAAMVFTCLFNIKLASSQYSDLLLGVLFLAGIILFSRFLKTPATGHLVLMAITLGLLSFTKTEGLLLAVITAGLTTTTILCTRPAKDRNEHLSVLLTSLAVALIPTIMFMVFFTPDSHTFINGLSSADKPSGLSRLQVIAFFFGHEMIDMKWNGFWILCLAGLIISGKRCVNGDRLWIPATLIFYLGAISAFYYINTFFEIAWWMSTTLNRVLFSLTPAMAWWVFTSLEQPQAPRPRNPQGHLKA